MLSGFVAPLVEEQYFRGFLLPRISRFGIWSVVLNSLLFTLYHTWTPWLGFTRFLMLLPMVYAVWRLRSIRIGIWIHVLLNTIDVSLAIAALLFGFSSS